jgi:hypothetical protein
MSNNTTLTALSAQVLASIADRFEDGDAGELLFTSPVDETSYDLYACDVSGTWDIIVDDMPSDGDARLSHLPSIEAAKARVAEIIAEKILAAQTAVANATTSGLIAA